MYVYSYIATYLECSHPKLNHNIKNNAIALINVAGREIAIVMQNGINLSVTLPSLLYSYNCMDRHADNIFLEILCTYGATGMSKGDKSLKCPQI